jgi:hypothetical protein
VLFLSNVDKAQVILLSSELLEQPEFVQFGGSLTSTSPSWEIKIAKLFRFSLGNALT